MAQRQAGTPTVHKSLEQAILQEAIFQKVKEEVSHIEEKNEKLKEELDKLKKKESTYNVRVQLQILYFLGCLTELTNTGTLEQKGKFFGALLNRHPQRARKPFSSINNLVFSPNKAEAKNIRKDLITTAKQFRDYGKEDIAIRVQEAIKKIDETHFKKL